MKGWIYVISNRAMPGIVKIGYSTKDPKLRADDFSHTGSPHPFIVEYEMLTEEPFKMEQQIHNSLSGKREGKEWFRCSVEDAIMTIKKVASSSIIYENVLTQEKNKQETILNGDPTFHKPLYYKCSNCGTTNKISNAIGITQRAHCASCKLPMCLNDNCKL